MNYRQQLALHNAQAELEALRAEGRGMVWSNERAILGQRTPLFGVAQFDDLAARIRATKVEIDDVLAFGSATR